MTEELEPKREFDGVMWVLGSLVAAPSMISVVQHAFDIGLQGAFLESVAHYRRLATPVIDLVQLPISALLHLIGVSWDIPQWCKDLHALSFVGAGIFARATDSDSRTLLSITRIFVTSFGVGFLGLGLGTV